MSGEGRRASLLRVLAVFTAAVLIGYATYRFRILRNSDVHAWTLLGIGSFFGAIAIVRFPLGDAPNLVPTYRRVSIVKRIVGWSIALGAAGWWGYATWCLYTDWRSNFDFTWLSWVGAAALMSIGLDMNWGAERQHNLRPLVLLVPIVLVAAYFRLYDIENFPGPSEITQIEDLQNGSYGHVYLSGERVRWEFIGHMWLSALALKVLGPTLAAMRTVFATVSVLKVIPLFFWLRWSAGTTAAVVGSLLLAFSSWDAIIARIPCNPNTFAIALAFALLAGPARRGRPSAYVWLGVISGYILYEYMAYRLLPLLTILGGFAASMSDRASSWPVRIARPLLIVCLAMCMAVPLFFNRLHGRTYYEYFDAVHRARTFADNQSPTQKLETFKNKAPRAAGLFLFQGDMTTTRSLDARPLVDPVSATLLVLGLAFIVVHPLNFTAVLTMIGFIATLIATMVLTSDFNVIRLSSTTTYTYAVIGYGAAGLWSLLYSSQRWRRWFVVGAGLIPVAIAAYMNMKHITDYWNSPKVRRDMRHPLTYLIVWFAKELQEGEQVLGVAPDFEYALGSSDAAWLKTKETPGRLSSDILTALNSWTDEFGPTLFVLYAGYDTPQVQHFTEWLLGIRMQVLNDELGKGLHLAYAHFPSRPAILPERLSQWRCFTTTGQYEIVDASGRTIAVHDLQLPYIDRTTWPTRAFNVPPETTGTSLTARINLRAKFRVEQRGTYRFRLQSNLHPVELSIDGTRGEGLRQLDRGVHELVISGKMRHRGEPHLRLFWSPANEPAREEIMPLYLLAEPPPGCPNQMIPSQ